mgnify:CR=1 FL=1
MRSVLPAKAAAVISGAIAVVRLAAPLPAVPAAGAGAAGPPGVLAPLLRPRERERERARSNSPNDDNLPRASRRSVIKHRSPLAPATIAPPVDDEDADSGGPTDQNSSSDRVASIGPQIVKISFVELRWWILYILFPACYIFTCLKLGQK